METKMMQFVLKKGLIWGGILSAVLLLEYVIDKNLMLSWWLGPIVGFGVPILGMVLMIREYRIKHNEGYVEFKEAFSIGFGVAAGMMLIYTFATILLYHVIDPSLLDFIVDGTIEKTVAFMESLGTPEDDIQNALAALEKMEEQFTVGALMQGYVMNLIIWAIFSLIIAAFTKKARPLFDDTLD